jgi:hypothetical protein
MRLAAIISTRSPLSHVMLGGVFYNKLMKAFETKAAPVTEDAEAEE